MLRHADLNLPFIVSGDASDTAIAAVLSQVFDGEEHPVSFFSRTTKPAERNYGIGDKELLPFVEAFRVWRHLLEGAQHKVTMFTDHNNHNHWQESKTLNQRQIRWSQKLASVNFEVKFRPRKFQLVPDALSHRPDYHSSSSTTNSIIPPTAFVSGASLDARLIVPPAARLKILQQRHDHPLSGHLGVEKTTELISRDFVWDGMHKDIADYVKSCDRCARAKHSRSPPAGKLVPLPIPPRPWYSVGVDFITDLPV